MTGTPTDWFTELNTALKPFQRDVRDFIVDTPRCGVFLTMASGKSMITLSALAAATPPGHILIIAPKNIADNTWPNEVEKWNIPIRTKSLHLTAPSFYKNGKPKKQRLLTPDERRELFSAIPSDPPTMYFTTLQGVAGIIEYFAFHGGARKTADFGNWPFGTMILDESQSFKDPSTKRYKALKQVAHHTERVILLTGTPAAESLENLWAQTYLLDHGARLGRSLTAFRERWFYPAKVIPGVGVAQWEPLDGSKEQIFDAIGDIALHRKNNDLELPGSRVIPHSVSLSDYERDAYRRFKKESLLNVILDHGLDPATADPSRIHEIISDNAAVLRGRLLQFAAGSIKLDIDRDHPDWDIATEHTTQPVLTVHDHKITCVTDIITGHMTHGDASPILLAYRFIAERDRLVNSLTAAGVDARVFDGSTTMYNDWNARKIPVMLIHPASAGHGLNLQWGGHTLIWASLPDSGEHYEQTNARLNRPGQDTVVDIHTVVTSGTIDASIPAKLADKGANQNELLDALDTEFDDTLLAELSGDHTTDADITATGALSLPS